MRNIKLIFIAILFSLSSLLYAESSFDITKMNVSVKRKNSLPTYNRDFTQRELEFMFKKEKDGDESLFMVMQSSGKNSIWRDYEHFQYFNQNDKKSLRALKEKGDGEIYAVLYNGKLVQPAQYILKPIEDEPLYLFFYRAEPFNDNNNYDSSHKHVSVYNEKTNEFRYLGRFVALKDLDNDNVPEIVVVTEENRGNDYYVVSYKIVQKNNQLSVVKFSKNRLKEDIGRYKIDKVDMDVKYFKDSNLIILKKARNSWPYLKEYKSGSYDFKANYSRYVKAYNFDKWNKTDVFKFRPSSIRFDYDSRSFKNLKDLKKRTKLNIKVTEPLEYQVFMESDKMYCITKFENLNISFQNFVICRKGGKGVYRFKNDRFLIKDSDYYHTLYLQKGKIGKKDIYFMTDGKKYLIIYDIKTKKANYFNIKKVLGYTPDKIVYFKDNELIVATKGRLEEYHIDYKETNKLKW